MEVVEAAFVVVGEGLLVVDALEVVVSVEVEVLLIVEVVEGDVVLVVEVVVDVEVVVVSSGVRLVEKPAGTVVSSGSWNCGQASLASIVSISSSPFP